MPQDREHPLYHLDAETLIVATYIWVDDELKALVAQGFKLPKKQKHQKATLAELLALAIFLLRKMFPYGEAARARTSPKATSRPRLP
ncbi:hypothetical protein TthAA37_25560 (plasmid) [Thermus thermophilus]|jgi:hypothetical protein|uniref:Transposase n=2 Tax=Thermus TaxID=270 RepID=A0A1G7LZD6_9DEIN|nr:MULTISPECIES: hypothetical protein [Thermus]ALJ92216.1 putative protein-transposase [Thermus aquaticus Y51MC23]BCZ92972.1 hypothetical protein TthAA37_21610 [Thermus thermophilus]BCZ93367.1 hypothetical protein TthAA37_25560 [Thermus thermophilus]SDF54319.1 hypothetical protein SAMN04488243_1852 [Thermus arciformis]